MNGIETCQRLRFKLGAREFSVNVWHGNPLYPRFDVWEWPAGEGCKLACIFNATAEAPFSNAEAAALVASALRDPAPRGIVQRGDTPTIVLSWEGAK